MTECGFCGDDVHGPPRRDYCCMLCAHRALENAIARLQDEEPPHDPDAAVAGRTPGEMRRRIEELRSLARSRE